MCVFVCFGARVVVGGGFTLQAGSRKKSQKYSPANVHAIFLIQTVNFCTRLLCAIAKTSPVVPFFLSDFSSVKGFRKMWPTLDKHISARKKNKLRKSGVGMGMYNTCAKFQGLSLKNGVAIWMFARKNE